jgi:PleD family two-component response regulator
MRALTTNESSGYVEETDVTPHRHKDTDTLEQRTVADLMRENANLRRMLAKLQGFRSLAYRDALTGLWNRRYFDERISEELSRAGRDDKRRFSIMAVDVNDLKNINDSEGHAGGDRAIKWVANFLKDTLPARADGQGRPRHVPRQAQSKRPPIESDDARAALTP